MQCSKSLKYKNIVINQIKQKDKKNNIYTKARNSKLFLKLIYCVLIRLISNSLVNMHS